MKSLSVFWMGARPKTLPAAIAPVIVATAYAGKEWNPTHALAALIVAISLQIAVNYANDYSDGIRGTDRDRVGPTRLVASGLARAKSVKVAAYIAFAVAILSGTFLALSTSPWLFLIGALAILSAWGYTGGEKPYGYRGLGEVSVFIFFGLVASIGTYFVQTEEIDFTIALFGMAMGSIACCILLLNNIRDRQGDEASGKRTLTVRIGLQMSVVLYSSLMSLALAIFLFAVDLPWNFLALLLFPILFVIRKEIARGSLIRALELTGKFQMAYALALSLALIVARG
ncbi:MAG: 1,4-dihydroxy-2-naphthoate polyprenyltransferase [Candidatus Nanopelagicaceae bacterium]